MNITREQLEVLNKLTVIKIKRLKTYFGYFNEPYDKNPRKEYIFTSVKTNSSSIRTLKNFVFLIDNIKCRHAKDIIIHNNIRFSEIRPDLFNESENNQN